jgi:cholinesterase
MRTLLLFGAVLLLFSIPLLGADPGASIRYPAVIVYGDSYSDNGNDYRVLNWPGAPYWRGRFSNGPVAVEDLATAFNAPTFDFAWGGGTTGVGNVVDGGTAERLGNRNLPGMTTALHNTGHFILPSLVPRALWVVWGSPNDFASDGYSYATADAAVQRVLAIVTELQRMGARYILVPGMCDMGVVPEYVVQGPQVVQWVRTLSVYFNQKLLAGLPRNVMYYNTFAFYDRLTANPGGYGLTNAADPCYSNGIVCARPDQYFFWDDVHPTAHVHSLLGQRFYATATGTFPPP